MNPFARLQGLAGRSFDAVSSALSEVSGRLNHEFHRIAITGLQRARRSLSRPSHMPCCTRKMRQRGNFPSFRGEAKCRRWRW